MQKAKKRVESLDELPGRVMRIAQKTGIDKNENQRSGSFFQLDESAVFARVAESLKGKIEILDTLDALEKYPWLSEYHWQLIEKNKDKYTKIASKESLGGYFLRIMPGAKIDFPIQSCMFISRKGFVQKVHNMIIAEPGSEAQIITGCAVTEDTGSSEHIGISEFYIKKGAKLTFTMIHNWNPKTVVRPRSAAVVEENATFISNYIILQPVADLQMYPIATCRGKNSISRFSTLLYAEKNSKIDVGSRVNLLGDNSRAEIISRAIGKDRSNTIMRGMLETNNPTAKAHLECRGLLLGDDSVIHAIPELLAQGEGADMSHEAAVGKIAEKEIIYLMSRGLSKDNATALIIRGFLDTSILNLPERLDNMIKELTEKVSHGF